MKYKKLSKEEIEERIKETFSKDFSKNLSQEQINKIKKLAMSKNLKLKSMRKLFCKKCLTFFTSKNSQIQIKMPFKIIKCKDCGYVNRWRMK